MTGFKNPSPSNPTPKIVEDVLRPLSTRTLLIYRDDLVKNPKRNVTRIEILDKILAERGYESLYSGPSGPRCAARDHALYLAETRGIPPFTWSERYGHMFATDVDGNGLVTYRAASLF